MHSLQGMTIVAHYRKKTATCNLRVGEGGSKQERFQTTLEVVSVSDTANIMYAIAVGTGAQKTCNISEMMQDRTKVTMTD